MTDYQPIEGRRYHCGQIVRKMAPRQLRMFEDVFGNAHRALSGIFITSTICRAWLIDGELAALGGVQSTIAGSDGFIWLALSEKARNHKFAMVREARRQLGTIMEVKTVVRSRVVPGDTQSRRFALLLGFRPGTEDTIEYRREWPMVQTPFVVFSLPRSKSRWLASFLSHGAECSHDLSISASNIDELCEAIGRGGTVETGLTMAWRVLRERFPDIRFAVVRRPIPDVVRSADRIGWTYPRGHLELESARLDEISALAGTMTLDFDDLSNRGAARELFEHCTGTIMSDATYDRMNAENIQVNVHERTRTLIHAASRMRRLFDEIRARVTIQQERFDDFYEDSHELFAEHYAEAGSFYGLPLDPDVEMARALEANNQLLVMTARQDGRMVGYIVYPINRLFESKGYLVAFRNIWFVRKGFRGGLGIKLKRIAERNLFERGVRFVMDRRGVRARGPHMDALYRREGAMDMGEMYMRPLVA